MKRHILLVTDHIGEDGTGRFITYLANGLAQFEDYKVSLLTFHHEEKAFNKDITSKVNVIELNLKHRIRYSLPTIINKIAAIAPHICIILYTQLVYLSLFAYPIKKSGTRILFRETIIPSMYRGKSSWLSKYICRKSYQNYDAIIAQSNDMSNDLTYNWGVSDSKINVINNPISIKKIQERIIGCARPADMPKGNLPVYLSAGRLSYQKGYDTILKRLSEMKPKIPFEYYIIGDGESKEEIIGLIEKYKLSNTVKLLGFKSNPYDYISNCDALVLSSRYEGFPNIVLEANALGKPVFTNRCPGGINEIIENGINGIACDFEKQSCFEKGLKVFQQTAFDSVKIEHMITSRYGCNIIMSRYKEFIDGLNDT